MNVGFQPVKFVSVARSSYQMYIRLLPCVY